MQSERAFLTGLHSCTVALDESRIPAQTEACDLQHCCYSCPAGHLRPTGMQQSLAPKRRAQMAFFSAAVQNAFTTVFAGFAFTTTVFPNISLLPALVAGFRRVLIMQSPGMVNLPALFTSLVATLARVSKILETSDFFRSCAVAMASARPVLVMTGLLDFIDFIAFIGAILKMK